MEEVHATYNLEKDAFLCGARRPRRLKRSDGSLTPSSPERTRASLPRADLDWMGRIRYGTAALVWMEPGSFGYGKGRPVVDGPRCVWSWPMMLRPRPTPTPLSAAGGTPSAPFHKESLQLPAAV